MFDPSKSSYYFVQHMIKKLWIVFNVLEIKLFFLNEYLYNLILIFTARLNIYPVLAVCT